MNDPKTKLLLLLANMMDKLQGPKGDMGTLSLKVSTVEGPKGPEGPQGPQGPQGHQGPEGTPTNLSLRFSTIEGPRGKDGKDGKDGKNGKDGKDGKNGKDGKDGKTPTVKAVENKVIDKIEDKVQRYIRASKTVSIKELDDVNLDSVTVTDGKYVLGTGGGGGGGDVSKVGTPVDNEIGVWTGDGTLEGGSNLTWDGNEFRVTRSINGVVGAFVGQGGTGAGMVGYNDDGSAVQSGDRLGYLLFGGASDSSHTLENAVGITAFATEDFSGSQNGAEFRFEKTTNGSTSRSEALRIQNDGTISMDGGTTSISSTELNKLNGLTGSIQEQPSEGAFENGDKSKLDGIETGAEVNNMSDANATELTDGSTTTLHSHSAPSIPMIILTKSSSINQNVGGANGTEVYWTWDGETIKDTGFTFTATDTEVTVDEDGWYEITFIGGAQTTGSSRTTLQGIHRINGGTTSRAGGLRNYTRGSSYGNITTGLIYTVQLSADDVIEVGTRVEDSDSTYTINTSGGEISDECHQLVIKKIR